MASRWFLVKEIICLISSLQNLWNSALIMQHRLLSNILKRRTYRHGVLKLLLCDKVISKEEKKCERKKREYWICLGRTKQWWLQFLKDKVIADEWKENFRMSKRSFLVLCKKLCQYISKNTRFLQDFKNLLLWSCKLLLKCMIFLTRDNLEKPQIHLELLRIQYRWSFDEWQKWLQITLLTNTLNFHGERKKLTNPVLFFFEKHGFPQCLGAVDRTHFTIKRPSEISLDYINREGRYSLNTQAVADRKYCFIDVSIKWLGCVHDAWVFSNSSANKKLRNGNIPKYEKVIMQNEPPVLVGIFGDPAYLLLSFLMKEFANGGKN